MAPNYGLLSTLSARLSSKVRWGRYFPYTTLFCKFFGLWNYAVRNGQKCLKLLKSILGQVKASVEVNGGSVNQFSDFLEGLISVSAHCGVRGGSEGGPRGVRGFRCDIKLMWRDDMGFIIR